MRFFFSKNIHEVLVIKDNEYSYIAECTITRNGNKQIWRYTSSCDAKKIVKREYKRIVVS